MKSQVNRSREKSFLPVSLRIITAIIRHPKNFFQDLPDSFGMRQAFIFLAVSALFFSAASLIQKGFDRPLLMAAIYLLNAIGMVFILAGLGYVVMIPATGRKIRFTRVFRIYALASSVTLLFSWVPFLVVITEPWKWWLIGTGITRNCGLKFGQTVIVICLSIVIWMMLLRTVIPLISR